MPRLFLIDHSLHRPGGHHFDHALQVLTAAEQAGYQISVAANRRWRRSSKLPTHWNVIPLFRHHTYCQYSVLSGRSSYPCNPFDADGITTGGRYPLSSIRQALRTWDQRRRAQAFAKSCERLFRIVPLEANDQVFLPTISDFDLVGLSLFLRRFALRAQSDWHAQFHFSFLEGSKTKYASQSDRLLRMSQHFRRLLTGLDDVRLHFYATTHELTEQYRKLDVAPFHLLNYPVNPLFLNADEWRGSARPLRVLCAGGLREDKGSHELVRVIENMKRLGFAANRLQFWVQAKRPSRLHVGDAECFVLTHLVQQPPASAQVVCVPHPLDPDDYLRLLRSANVGLFLYDSERYYARCSGVLIELLTAGVPVIAPGGCWLGEQLRHPAASGVGLIANDRNDVPRLLAEIAEHYDHYAQAARTFAPKFFAMHRPQDVIATLLRTSIASRNRDQRAA